MKFRISSLALLSFLAFSNVQASVSIFDEFKFGGNVTSMGGKTFTLSNAHVGYKDGYAIIKTTKTNVGVCYLEAGYGLTDNWALQLDVSFQNTSSGAVHLLGTTFQEGSSNGLNLIATTTAGGSTFAFGKGSSNTVTNNVTVTGTNLQSSQSMNQLSIINKDSKIYFFMGDAQLSFGNGQDYLTHSDLGFTSGINLNQLVLGNGPLGNHSIFASDALTMGGLKVFKFDGADSLDDVKRGMNIMSVPEPATASMGMLGLVMIFLHRRRK